jgi:hypothetical protein
MKELVMAKLAEVEDVSVDVWEDGKEIIVTVEDFDGFDDDWCEIDREYDEEKVDALEEWLEEHCVCKHGDFYRYYEFDDFSVQWGYASMDI